MSKLAMLSSECWHSPQLLILPHWTGLSLSESIQALISLVLLGTSLIVVVSKNYADKDRNWAYGTVGALICFWPHLA